MVKAPGSREDGSEDENTWSGRGVVNADDGSGDVESVKKVFPVWTSPRTRGGCSL
jgi:hypothetical protein